MTYPGTSIYSEGMGLTHWIKSKEVRVQTPAPPLIRNCNNPCRNILRRDTCDPPFGYQTIVPGKLEFPQESHAGSRKRQKAGVSKNRDFTLFQQLVRPPCRRDWILGNDRSMMIHRAAPWMGPFKPEPHMPVPNDGLGGAVTGPIYLLLFPRQPY